MNSFSLRSSLVFHTIHTCPILGKLPEGLQRRKKEKSGVEWSNQSLRSLISLPPLSFSLSLPNQRCSPLPNSIRNGL